MDETLNALPSNPPEGLTGRSGTRSTISRRELFRLTLAGGSGRRIAKNLDDPHCVCARLKNFA